MTSFVDLSAIAPGVNVAKNEGFKTVITIRGIGNEANQNAIANPSVSYHLDGVYVASPFALQTDFGSRAYRGSARPSGHFIWSELTGGAINVITAAPSFDGFAGSADVSFGQYSSVRARANVNLPISDTLAARVSLLTNERDGYSRNVSNGQDLDDANSLSGTDQAPMGAS